MTKHYITLHYITLHYITLHYITLHYITLHYITLHYITLHYITLHYITLHYITKTNQGYTLLNTTNYDSRSLLRVTYFHMVVLVGGGNLTESQTKSFSKDCIIYAINIDPSS